nr:MAG TPA: hypothetical protein [Caudoviricetes sp.]
MQSVLVGIACQGYTDNPDRDPLDLCGFTGLDPSIRIFRAVHPM